MENQKDLGSDEVLNTRYAKKDLKPFLAFP